ncbi:WecB/TagA/CpsF family glycosyltransferase [Flavobacterium branchiophilum]|uniref:Probable glycosyl transferase n=1 Tax=Flavobacterium branchiophilum (strain FL-15) TaxID=1034807 RepID=G2Z6E9_FLABF|nr:WecB/TagA/CpsF family glycosyltransferase [Flavobacterium branchiophilum]CCB70971.1 Probable glycosyl transferase [Flavobacterium branchiophilum FL-15]
MTYQSVSILGIPFYKGKANQVFDLLNTSGGLLTVPAAPGLANIPNDAHYYQALLHSDIIIPDSGYMTLIWNLFFSPKLHKISGLEFINYFIDNISSLKNKKIFLINPSDLDGQINQKYFGSLGHTISDQNVYTAPFYEQNTHDEQLLNQINLQKPDWIIINIGGGTQEKLGLFLKQNLFYKPVIICTGAALAFKTGRQVQIPKWIDYIYLGWLHRCISSPKNYIPRYWNSFKLFFLLIKYQNKPITDIF